MALQDVFDVLLTIAIVALLALADRLIRNRGWPRVPAYLVAVGLGGAAAVALRTVLRHVG